MFSFASQYCKDTVSMMMTSPSVQSASATVAVSPTPTALLSVYDKTNLVPFAKALVERFGYQLLATGGTHKALVEAGLPSTEVADVTGYGELLEGRVKSLHPEVFAGILAKRASASHMAQVSRVVDLVVVNLYPFQSGLAKVEAGDASVDLVELIDIGGSALIRAGAKNHADVAVVSNPLQYEAVLVDLLANENKTSLGLRQRLALEAFQLSASYDNAISGWMINSLQAELKPAELLNSLPPVLNLALHNIQPMRYGENPHQPAALYTSNPDVETFHVLHGKALSYNNILDMEAAWALISDFVELPTAAIIKHTQPCGVAEAPTLAQAFQQALDCDPLSAFGGIVALNRPVDEPTAKLLHALFLEVIVAPGFTEEALAILTQKKNIRLVTRPTSEAQQAGKIHPAQLRDGRTIRQVSPELFLVQEQSFAVTEALLAENMKVVTSTKPSKSQLKEAAFAWRVVKHLKSNGIAIVQGGKTVGLCGGQTSRVGAVEQAVAQACEGTTEAILASDGFFPAVDNIQLAAQNRIAVIIQPGGSIKDPEVIAACNQYGIAMIFTGVREFKH